jgi:[citrate (pro-3S)-lyase] ligase
MWDGHFEQQAIQLKSEAEKRPVEAFLQRRNLALDRDVEYTVVLLDGERIVATGSFSERVLKCIAVDEEYANMGLASQVVTQLVIEEFNRGRPHLFVYTKPENKSVFSELGFYLMAEVPNKVVLMENRADGIKNYLKEIGQAKRSEKAAAAVVNCNPFTLGHRYLIEYAAARCRQLHLFVVWEDRSSFPAEIRYKLVREGVRDLANVTVHQGKDYIISAATFPSYFIKEYQEQVEIHARLDLEVFARYIVPALGIEKRFVGEEPYCKVTAAYNEIMQEVLPARGVTVEIVPRLTDGGQAISAFRVRELIRSGQIEATRELVPESTYHFLVSPEARKIIDHIQKSNSQRH